MNVRDVRGHHDRHGPGQLATIAVGLQQAIAEHTVVVAAHRDAQRRSFARDGCPLVQPRLGAEAQDVTYPRIDRGGRRAIVGARDDHGLAEQEPPKRQRGQR